uniref:Uncharacterized protein n=1 Tax=Glossina austeni TaxID=7395 RepID=A0A1A9UGF3_GLOAU
MLPVVNFDNMWQPFISCSTETTENTNNKTEHNIALERSANRGSTISSVSPIYHEAAATSVKRQISSAKITSENTNITSALDIIKNHRINNRFQYLKGQVKERFSLSERAKFDKILRDSEISDHKSSDFYRPIATLIASGAEILILPVTKLRNYEHSSNVTLIAASGSPVPIFDKKLLNVNLGLRREFSFAFTLVTLSNPIISADVLCKYGLTIDVKHKGLAIRFGKTL